MPRKRNTPSGLVVAPVIDGHIRVVRGRRVLLDSDLAVLYGVATKALNQAIQRNIGRFPADFMFQLTREEFENLRSQTVTSSIAYGGRRYLPYAFTQEGVAMLSSVLRSPRAVAVNIEIMRAFVRLRRLLLSVKDLSAKVEALEQKYDEQFGVVFTAIKALMAPSSPSPEEEGTIGFLGTPKKPRP
jgi:hypothetical protein